MARHAVELRELGILRNTQTSSLLDVGKTDGPIATRPRKDDCDCLCLLILGQRTEELVNRMTLAARRIWLNQLQYAVVDQQCLGRDDDVDAVRLDTHAVFDLHDRHFRLAAQDIGEHALAGWVEMLDNDKPHAGRNLKTAR